MAGLHLTAGENFRGLVLVRKPSNLNARNGIFFLFRCLKRLKRYGTFISGSLPPAPQWSSFGDKFEPSKDHWPEPSESGELSVSQKRLSNPLHTHLVEKWVDLQLALEQSLMSPVEPDRMSFVIGSHFARIKMEPKTAVDRVIASARGVDD